MIRRWGDPYSLDAPLAHGHDLEAELAEVQLLTDVGQTAEVGEQHARQGLHSSLSLTSPSQFRACST